MPSDEQWDALIADGFTITAHPDRGWLISRSRVEGHGVTLQDAVDDWARRFQSSAEHPRPHMPDKPEGDTDA